MSELARLNGLFSEFSDASLVAVTKSEEAFANEVFDVTSSDDQRYFLKILKEQSPKAIAVEAQMQQRLINAGLGTPEYLEIRSGNYVGEHGGEKFVLSKYIPGESPKTVTPKLVASLGATLARIHRCFEGVTIPDNDMQWLNLERAERDIASYSGPAKSTLSNLISFGRIIFDHDLPKAITHGDLWLSNVFTADDEVTTVFDLETAERTVRIIDLARTYTSLRFNSDYSSGEIVDMLTAGYNSEAEQALSEEEMQSMNRAIAYTCGVCATWHAIHGTRYKDPYIQLGSEAMSS